MTERDWNLIQATHDTVQTLSLRFVVIEEQVKTWRNRERWFYRSLATAVIGFTVWFLQHNLSQ